MVNFFVDFLERARYAARMPDLTRRETALGSAFDALANAQRRAILARLARGPASTPEIASRFGFTKQALSRHLTILERAGLIQRRIRGRTNDLALMPAPLDDVSQWIAEIGRGWQASLDRLDLILRSQ
jgi:DNA-binding transcriptional ArsR family regulator